MGMGMYTVLYLKWITNKDLLYSTWNSAQCYVAAWMGGEFGGEAVLQHPKPTLATITVFFNTSGSQTTMCCRITPKKVLVTQLCPTLCDPMDYTVHGILQARILEWVAMPFSRGSSQPSDRTQVSHILGGFFTS